MIKKKRKLKKKRIFFASSILILLIIFIVNLPSLIYNIKLSTKGYDKTSIKLLKENNIKLNKYSKTLDNIINTKYFILDNTSYYIDIDYHDEDNFYENINNLINKGYNTTEINKIYEKKIDTNIVLNNEYNKNILTILSSPYFNKDNLERYLEYNKEDDIVLNVNMNLDYDFYTHDININEVNTNVIVNKYYKLDSNYIPELVKLDRKYSINDRQLVTKETKEAFEKMASDARNEGIYIYSGSAYRSYSYQNTLYSNRVKTDGLEYANNTAAKAGYSEHQTGMALDLMNKNYEYLTNDDKEYTWLIENSYKYGFILRYPSDKTEITGYSYEPWHFRYITIDIATYLKENNLVYEEYIGMNLK